MEKSSLIEWTTNDIKSYLKKEGFQPKSINILCDGHNINGKSILALNDSDFTLPPLIDLNLHDRKLLYIMTKCFQKENHSALHQLCLIPENIPLISNRNSSSYFYNERNHNNNSEYSSINSLSFNNSLYQNHYHQNDRPTVIKLPPEKTKAFLSFCYVVGVTWITAFVMVIVHDRVPDMKKYPPLPDIFLDNVPHIPWAFDMCEVTGSLMFSIWLIVLLFHKYRFILMRRFFALSGTVFLLRCITMLITSLSVPGAHLQCEPRNFSIHGISSFDELANKLSQAYVIWRGAGMSIQGVRTCGDYMFSGHTVALTMLNFFITEYTPRYVYYLHILSWMMNMFGIFFILAAHEHYSIDVFVAFYITSRLFLYYHTLSNNQTLMQRDSTRTKVWFPLFSYFESSVKGIVPNEYETPAQITKNVICFFKDLFCDVIKSILELFRKDYINSNLLVNSRNSNGAEAKKDR